MAFDVTRATYALEFKDTGLSKAITLDKTIRDSMKQTQAVMKGTAPIVRNQQSEVLAATRAQVTAARQQQVAWKEAGQAARRASQVVAKSQQTQAVVVSKGITETVDKLRQVRISYDDIVKVMHRYQVDAQQVAAAIKRSSQEEVEATEKMVRARNRLRQAVGLTPTTTGRSGGMHLTREERGLERGALAGVSRRLRSGAGYVSGGLVGGLAGYLSVGGIKSAIDETTHLADEVQFLTKVTGMDQKQGAAWIAVAKSRGVTTSQLAQSFMTLGRGAAQMQKNTARAGQETSKSMDHLASRAVAAMGHSKSAILEFVKAGVTQQDVAKRQHNIGALYDFVTKKIAGMRAGIAKTTVAQQLLGKTSFQSAAAVQAFKDLGITQKDISERSKNMGDFLGYVADRLNKMPGGLQKTRDEAALLGRSYQNLNPLIADGSKGMEEARKKAQAYGITLGGNAYRNAQKMMDAQRNLKLASLGLQVQFAEHLGPSLIGVMGTFLKFTVFLGHTFGPVIKHVVSDVKDVVHWFGKNKAALHALEITAGTLGGLFAMAKTLQMLSRLSQGLMHDWRTLKGAGQVVWDLLHGETVKLSEAFTKQATQEEIAQKQTQVLIQIEERLATAYGETAVAADEATAAQARAAETGGGALPGGGLGGAARAAGPEAAALATTERGLVGGEREAQAIAQASARQIPYVGMQGVLFGKQGAQQMANTLGRASATSVAAGKMTPGGAIVAKGAAAEAEQVAAKGGGLLSKLGGLGGGLLEGGGIAGIGLMGAQLGGSILKPIIGNKLGGALQNIGTGAAIGAGIGTAIPIPGIGTGVGAGVGALVGLLSSVGGSPTDKQDAQVRALAKRMQASAKSGNVTQLQAESRQAERLAQSYGKVSNRLTSMGRASGRLPDLSKQVRQLQRMAQGANQVQTAMQGQRVNQFVRSLAGIRMPDVKGMVGQFTTEFGKVAPSLRQTGAKAMLQLAESLQQQGKLPKNAVQHMIGDLEKQFPGLTTFLRQQGLTTDRQVANSLKLAKARASMRSTVSFLQQQYGGMPQTAQKAGAGMETMMSGSMDVLKRVMSDGTKSQRAAAEREYSQLRDNASTYFKTMATNVTSEQQNMTKAIQGGSTSAATTATTQFQNYEGAVQTAMSKGLISVSQGNKLITQALNATLKAFGAKQIPAPNQVGRIAGSVKHLGGQGFAGKVAALHTGGWMPGDPHSDSTLALLSGNEFVMTGHGQAMMDSLAPGLLDHIAQLQMPHFQAGGFAGDQIATPQIHGTGTIPRESQAALRKATKAANARLNKIEAQMAGGTGGGNAANERLGRQMMLGFHGGIWGPGQWPYLEKLWTQESGWNANAVNPTSGAAGIPQALGHGKVFPLGQPRPQIAWGLNYIQGRYGSPQAAWAHEVANNWYRQGGFVRSFQNGGFASDVVQSVGGWTYGTPTKGHKKGAHPKGLSEVTVPGTGVKGVLARHEWLSRTGALVGSTYQGLPVVSQSTYDHQKQTYQLASRHGKAGDGHFGKLSFTGAVSTFGPPSEAAHGTAYGGSDAAAGIAINPGPAQGDWNSGLAKSLKGKMFLVQVGGHRAYLPVIDKGPSALATHGPRAGHVRTIDITGAGAQKMGIPPQAFPTDAIGTAREWIGKTGSIFTDHGVTTFKQAGKGLAGVDAFYQAYLNALDPTQGMSPQVILNAAIGGATLVPRKVSASSMPGKSGAGLSGQFVSFRGQKIPAQIQRAFQIGNYEAGRHIPYGTGEHGAFYGLNAPSMDCSGLVSTVLHWSGLDQGHGHMLTGDLKRWGVAGPGKYLTVGVLGADSGPTGHTMMEVLGRFFESGGGKGGPHTDSGWSSNFPWKRHYPGMAAGGFVNRRRRDVVGAPGYQPTRAELRKLQNQGVTMRRGGRLPRFQGGGFTSAITRAPRGGAHPKTTTIRTPGARTAIQLPSNLQMPLMQTSAGSLPGAAVDLQGIIAQMPISAVNLGVAESIAAIHAAVVAIHGMRPPRGANTRAFDRLRNSIKGLGKMSEGQLEHTATTITRQIKALRSQERHTRSRAVKALDRADIKALQDALGVVATLGKSAQAVKNIHGAIHTIISTPNNAKIRAAMGALSKAVNDTQAVSYQQLVRTANEIQREINKVKSPRQKNRLTQALKLVQAAEGARVGTLVKAATDEEDALQTSQTALQNLMNRQNISTSSAQGTAMMEAYQKQVVVVLQDSVAKLQLAYKQAVAAKDPKAEADIADKLKAALGSLDQATGDLVQAHVAAVEAAAQAIADAAQHQVSMAAGQTSMLAAGLTASGGDQTMAGGRQLAQSYYAQANAIQGQISALKAQQWGAASVGDTALATQIGEAVQQAQGDWQSAMLSATQAIKAGIQGTIQAIQDQASFNTTMAQTGLANFQLTQQLAGTQDTPGGRAAYAGFITTKVIPALQGQLAADRKALTLAYKEQDKAAIKQIKEAIETDIGSILQAQLDAQTAIKDNTAAMAGALQGELAVSFESQIFPDLGGMLNGA